MVRAPGPRATRKTTAPVQRPPAPSRARRPHRNRQTHRRIHAVIDCRHNGDTWWPATPNSKLSGERTAPIAVSPKLARGAALGSLRRLALDALCAARPLRSVSNWALQATRARKASLAVVAEDGPTRRNDEVQHGRAGSAHRAPGRTRRARAHQGRAGTARDARGLPARLLRAGRSRRPRRPAAGRPLRRGAVALGLRAQARAGPRARARVQSDDRGARLAVDAHDHRDRQRRHVVPRRLGHDGSEPARAHAAPHRPSDHRRHPRRGRDADRRGGRGRGRRQARVVHPRRGRSRQRPCGARDARGRRRARAVRRAPRRRRLEGDAGHGARASRPSSRSARRRFPAAELAEGRAFLAWLAENHFTFLGYRRHELVDRRRAGRAEDRPRLEPGHPAREGRRRTSRRASRRCRPRSARTRAGPSCSSSPSRRRARPSTGRATSTTSPSSASTPPAT